MECTNEVTVNELVQMCKFVESKNVKEALLANIAQKLKKENFKSLDRCLKQNIHDIYNQIYKSDLITLFEHVLEPRATTSPANQNQQGCSQLCIRSQEPIIGEETLDLTTNNVDAIQQITQEAIIGEEPLDLTINGVEGSPQDSTMGSEDAVHDLRINKSNAITRKRASPDQTAFEDQPGTSTRVGEREKADSRVSVSNYFKYIEIINNKNSFNAKFNLNTAETTFKFKNTPLAASKLNAYLHDAFNEIIAFITQKALPHHKIGIKISLPNFNSSKDIGINFTDVSKISGKDIASLLYSVSQSNSNFQLTDALTITSVLLLIPHGTGRIMNKRTPSDEIIRLKCKSILNIEINEPIYCLPIAILLGKCIADNEKNKIRLYRRNKNRLMDDIHSLIKLANVQISENFGSNIIQIASYQKVMLPKYNIVVFNDKENFANKLFDGNNRKGRDINIFYFEDISHFVSLRNVKTFFCKRYQCKLCLDLYDYEKNHLCAVKCRSCESSPPCNRQEQKIKCDECKRYFYGEICYNNHHNSVCKILKFCNICAKLIDMRKREYKEHSCDEKKCTICLNIVDSTHQCYVQKYRQKSPSNFSVIFYDLECTQNLSIENETYLHQPNLCVVHIVCNKCIMIPHTDYRCSTCVQRQHVFENCNEGNCVKKFVDFCEIFRKDSAAVFCIAHNFKAYDGQFILQELVKRKKSIKPIMGGMKIYRLTYDDHIVFIDSLNFLPMSLSKFPETFGLENLTKGWYPHFFNTVENYNYIGAVPERKYFGVSHMSEQENIKFNIWYTDRISSGLGYNNREELIQYCVQDVEILRKGCVSFIESFSKVTGINPMLQSFTLAQAVMKAFRKTFLQENTLGIIPNNLYHHANKNQSFSGLKWLIFENRKCEGKIVYEVKIPTTKFYVDGFYRDKNTVYEYLGCYWHGCKTCFLNRIQPLNASAQDTFDTRYHQTCLRLDLIKSLGYKIIKVWGCKFAQFLVENPEIDNSLENDPQLLHKYLNPRDALYGGRTETFQLYYKAKQGEKIQYYDFTSLYPYVNKTGKNPIHHPKIHYMDDCKNLDISNIDGLIKCSVLPPQDILIPVLPLKINNKLLFPLCRTCAEKENITNVCTHTEEERMLIGTWVLDEVKLALNNHYKICKIFEVWEYETSQYNQTEKAGGIFTEYMNCCLKLKQEASGWPSNITSEEEKQSYINEFFSHEGILLDPISINHNPSQRGCSKLALNALWGKFIQRNDRTQTVIIHSALELYNLISSPAVVLIDVIAVEEVIWVNWKYFSDDFVEPLKHVSLAIGAFTTSNARIKLYSELSKIPDKVLYCDTDSIIFVEDDTNKEVLKTGNFIGDLTNEIAAYGKNAFITEFASTGPKSYGYVIFDPVKNIYFDIAKCKGITLNIATKNVLNFLSLKNMVVDDNDEGFREVHDKKKIRRLQMLKVVSKPESKKFGFTYTKRVCLDEFKTIPYGFYTHKI